MTVSEIEWPGTVTACAPYFLPVVKSLLTVPAAGEEDIIRCLHIDREPFRSQLSCQSACRAYQAVPGTRTDTYHQPFTGRHGPVSRGTHVRPDFFIHRSAAARIVNSRSAVKFPFRKKSPLPGRLFGNVTCRLSAF